MGIQLDRESKTMNDNEIEGIDGLLKWIIRRYYCVRYQSGLTFEDFYQVGYIGYLKAMKNYNKIAANGLSMSKSYAKWYIRQEINKYLKGELTERNHNFKTDIEYTDEEELTHLVNDEHAKTRIKDMLRILNTKERIIIKRTYLTEDPSTLVELGKGLGISKQRVKQIQTAAINKLKDEFDDNDKH